MKRLVSALLAVLFCCSFFAVSPACADISHAKENLYAQSDYLVFSPEYSSARGNWELWVLAYKAGTSNRSGAANDELDKCVSASRLSLKNPAAAANTISTLIGQSYWLEDMMDFDDVRYYSFAGYGKKCYLASPGGELTSFSPVDSIEIMETRKDVTIALESRGSDPAFMLLCQFWLYSGRFSQIPSSVTKTYGMDSEQTQKLYSSNVYDYCSNQDKLQRYCDSLIPAVSSVSTKDRDKPHFMTDIYYRKGSTELCVSPMTDGLYVRLRSK